MIINPSTPIRVLVVDDEPSYLRLVSLFLKRSGYTVEIAHRGEVALGFADEVDVALVDMIMPGLSGLETIERMHLRNRELKVIASSGGSEKEFRSELDRLGIKDFLSKPFPIERLLSRIESLMGCVAALAR